MLSNNVKVHIGENNIITFRCPGCNETHQIQHGVNRWQWNGNLEKPTFTPSVLMRSGHFIEDFNKFECWCTFYKEHPPEPGEKMFKCIRCHSFVTDGMIRFLDDCSHELAGKTVELPDYDMPP